MQGRISITKPEATQDELTRLAIAFDHLHGLVANVVLTRMADALQGGEFSFSQLNALYRLYRSGPQTIAELAKGAALSQTASSRMVERLVQNGLAERHEVPEDRRQKRVELTEAGLSRLKELQAVTIQTYAKLLTEVPRDTQQRLQAILTEIRPHLPTHPLD